MKLPEIEKKQSDDFGTFEQEATIEESEEIKPVETKIDETIIENEGFGNFDQPEDSTPKSENQEQFGNFDQTP